MHAAQDALKRGASHAASSPASLKIKREPEAGADKQDSPPSPLLNNGAAQISISEIPALENFHFRVNFNKTQRSRFVFFFPLSD